MDARVENVVKTIARCAMYDARPRVFACDIERPDEPELLSADFCHHVGVLYHLGDPVSHLRDLGRWISKGVMLDTHYALESDAKHEYASEGRHFRYRHYAEHGRSDVFSGMKPSSKWLILDDIVRVLQETGFDAVEVAEMREERNGPRALLFAERGAPNQDT